MKTTARRYGKCLPYDGRTLPHYGRSLPRYGRSLPYVPERISNLEFQISNGSGSCALLNLKSEILNSPTGEAGAATFHLPSSTFPF